MDFMAQEQERGIKAGDAAEAPRPQQLIARVSLRCAEKKGQPQRITRGNDGSDDWKPYDRLFADFRIIFAHTEKRKREIFRVKRCIRKHKRMCRLTCHEHLPLQLSGQPQHTEHDAQHYEPPEDGGHPVVQLTAEAPPCPEKERQQTDEGHRRKLFPAGLLEHCSCPDKFEEIPEQKDGTAALSCKARAVQTGGVDQDERGKEHEGRCRQYIAQQDGADGAGLPCPEDGAAAVTLSASVWAENVCFCCIQDPLLCQMVNGRRDSAR